MRICFILIFLVTSLNVCSQIFKGRVVDETNRKALESASISVLKADSTTSNYTISDEKGFFSISVNDKSTNKYIHISCLGYLSQIFEISRFIDGSEISLSQSDIVLKEVEVKYERLKKTGDTLNYDVRGFRLDQDRLIKDVLKRLPGIEVKNDGRILFEGIPINNFYVENLDLSGNKYNIITNNLSAKSVKTVQILENHQPITTLRGSNFTDRAALNIVLEDDAKNVLMGAIDLGIGTEGDFNKLIWDNRVLAMLFQDKKQNVSIYKNNNIGDDIKEEIKNLIRSQDRRSSEPEEKGIINPLGVKAINNIDNPRFLFNDTHLLTTNFLTKNDNNKTFRIQAHYLHEQEKQNSKSLTTYFLPEANISILENLHVNDRKDQIESDLTYNLNSEDSYINNNLNFFSLFNSNVGNITGSENVMQSAKLDKFKLSNEFELIKKIGRNRLRLTSINTINILPQEILVSPNIFSNISNDSILNESITQKIKTTSFYSHTYTSFSHKISRINISYTTGFKLKTQLLNSSPTNFGEGSFPFDSLTNKLRFTQADLYVTPAFYFQNKKIRLGIDLNSTLRHIYNHDYIYNLEQTHKSNFILEPAFSLRYDANVYWKIFARSSYNKMNSDIYSMYPGYILKSYRYISNYNNDLTKYESYINSLGISYKNPIKTFFANLFVSYSIQKKDNLSKVKFDGILQQVTTLNQNVSNNTWYINFNLSKSLPFWSTLINFKYNFSDRGDTQFMTDVLTGYRNQMNDFNLSFSLQPIKKLNFEGEIDFSSSNLKIVSPEPKTYDPIRDYYYKISTNFIPSKKIQFKWVNSLYYNSQVNTPTVYFSDFSFSYLNKKSEVQLIANNIFNTHRYESKNMGTLNQFTNVTFLHERQLMIKYMFSF